MCLILGWTPALLSQHLHTVGQARGDRLHAPEVLGRHGLQVCQHD
jgi:hypothetical protein